MDRPESRNGHPAPSRGPGRQASRARLAVVVLVAALMAAVLPARSYVQALTAPGDAAWTTRTVDWLRDRGASPLVDTAENLWYGLHPPSDRPPEARDLPTVSTASAPSRDGAAALPQLVDAYGGRTVAGERTWQVRRLDARGAVLVATAFVRPDPEHAGVVAAVAWVRSTSVTAHLVAGTTIPGGPAWPGHADVPARDVPALVATFNSGWRTQDISGGFRIGNQTWPRLQPGQATAVVDRCGRVDVGVWGRDFGVSSDVVAARQNLALVVDQGQVAAGLGSNRNHQWGYRDNQHQFTYRSGIGVDRSGDLVYVAGSGMTLEVLAQALRDAGAVRAMQLDVHDGFPFFAVWEHAHGADTPTKLLASMGHDANRYLQPDQRDFFYLTLAERGR